MIKQWFHNQECLYQYKNLPCRLTMFELEIVGVPYHYIQMIERQFGIQYVEELISQDPKTISKCLFKFGKTACQEIINKLNDPKNLAQLKIFQEIPEEIYSQQIQKPNVMYTSVK